MVDIVGLDMSLLKTKSLEFSDVKSPVFFGAESVGIDLFPFETNVSAHVLVLQGMLLEWRGHP